MVEKSSASNFWPSFYEPFRQIGSKLAEWVAPASEASSNDNSYRIAIELPGVAEADIDISVDDRVVSVKGEKKTSREEKGDTWYFSERQYGSFARSFRLPGDADAQKVKADLKDGVLTISAPKTPPEKGSDTRKVAIGRG